MLHARTIVVITLLMVSSIILELAASGMIFENDQVIIWKLPSGAPESLPGVLVTLADGAVRFVDGIDSGTTDVRQAILIQLKEHRVPPIESQSGVARAFPREGARRVLDNDRVVVWDLTWTKNARTSLHFHDKDVVAVYLGAGTVRTTTVGGHSSATARTFGEAVFLPRGRTHTEECIDGPRRDIIIELK